MSPSDARRNRPSASDDGQGSLVFDEIDQQARVLLRSYLAKKRTYHCSFVNGQEAAIRAAGEDLESFLRACLHDLGGIERTAALLHAYAARNRRVADLIRLFQQDLLELHRSGVTLSATSDADSQGAPSSPPQADERAPADSTRMNRPLDSPCETVAGTDKFVERGDHGDLAALLDPASSFRHRTPPLLARNEETEELMLTKLRRLCRSLKDPIENRLRWARVREAIRDFEREFPLFKDEKLSRKGTSNTPDSDWLYKAADCSWWVRVMLRKKPGSFTSYKISTYPTLEREGRS